MLNEHPLHTDWPQSHQFVDFGDQKSCHTNSSYAQSTFEMFAPSFFLFLVDIIRLLIEKFNEVSSKIVAKKSGAFLFLEVN